MSKTWTLLTAALLMAGAAPGRADDTAGFGQPQPSSPRRGNDHWHTVWGSSDYQQNQKIVRVSATENADAAPAPEKAATTAPTAPAANDHWHNVWGAGAAMPAEAVPSLEAGPQPDHWHACHDEARGCAAKFWAWLTYQPLRKPGLCGCCCQCAPCTFPPLYQFFLCENQYYRGGCGGCGNCAVAGYVAAEGAAPVAAGQP